VRLAEVSLGVAFLAVASPAWAGPVVVADCAPSTVVAAATGARRALLVRAQTFHDLAPDYQQDQCMDFATGAVMPRNGACEAPTWWRTDCSGFVSCVWALSESLDTEQLGKGGKSAGRTWTSKSWEDLEPGDALNLPGEHVTLFTGWLDDAQTSFCVLEEIHVAYTDPWGGTGCIATVRSTAVSIAQGFTPIGLVGLDDVADSGQTGDAGSSADDGGDEHDAGVVDATMASRLPWLGLSIGVGVVVRSRRFRIHRLNSSRSPRHAPRDSHPRTPR
jgi:hypothetical protein